MFLTYEAGQFASSEDPSGTVRRQQRKIMGRQQRMDAVADFVSKLPDEEFVCSTLAAEFGVSSKTMRRGLDELVEDGRLNVRVEDGDGPIKVKHYSAQKEDEKMAKGKTKKQKKQEKQAASGGMADLAAAVIVPVLEAASGGLTASTIGARTSLTGEAAEKALEVLVEQGKVVQVGETKSGTPRFGLPDEEVEEEAEEEAEDEEKAEEAEDLVEIAEDATAFLEQLGDRSLAITTLAKRTSFDVEYAERLAELLVEQGELEKVGETRSGTPRYARVSEDETEEQVESAVDVDWEQVIVDVASTRGRSTTRIFRDACDEIGVDWDEDGDTVAASLEDGLKVAIAHGKIEVTGTKNRRRYRLASEDEEEPKPKAKKKAKKAKKKSRKAKRRAVEKQVKGVELIVGDKTYTFASDPDGWLPKICPTPSCKDRPVASTLEQVDELFGFRTPSRTGLTIPQGPCRACRREAHKRSARKKRRQS